MDGIGANGVTQYPEPSLGTYTYAPDPSMYGVYNPLANVDAMLTQDALQPEIGIREDVVITKRKTSGSTDTSKKSNTSSNVSSLTRARKRTNTKVTAKFRAEKPRKDSTHYWVRTNTTTAGKTSRTGKINQFDPSTVYKQLPNVMPDWHSSSYKFKYNKFGELEQKIFSVEKLRQFLFEHPKTKDCELKLWIQKSPADSARRYPFPHSNKCRFADCPMQVYQTGTILHGHYRIAFDEKWFKYRDNSDPFRMAGYVHLYCLERFMDFPKICRKLDIEVDERFLVSEPNARFAATLNGSSEAGIARTFIDLCKRRKLDKEFPDYPRHNEFHRGEQKPHEYTLTRAMNYERISKRPTAQVKEFERRGLQGSHVLIHMGDLEMFCLAKLARKEVKLKSKKRAKKDVEESDSEESEADDGIPQPKKRRYNTKKRRSVVPDTPDTPSTPGSPLSVDTPTTGVRRSGRVRKSVNYNDDRSEIEEGENRAPTPPHPDAPAYAKAQAGVPLSEAPTPRSSVSAGSNPFGRPSRIRKSSHNATQMSPRSVPPMRMTAPMMANTMMTPMTDVVPVAPMLNQNFMMANYDPSLMDPTFNPPVQETADFDDVAALIQSYNQGQHIATQAEWNLPADTFTPPQGYATCRRRSVRIATCTSNSSQGTARKSSRGSRGSYKDQGTQTLLSFGPNEVFDPNEFGSFFDLGDTTFDEDFIGDGSMPALPEGLMLPDAPVRRSERIASISTHRSRSSKGSK
ncbi:hypothetical protein M501DRAFT_994681 [Patellaria atrata CBS 101060]|uniref:Uncharacterized protein n=1 Tax=Patellaria atrata CBS 101060 TaxID=1346257 RepID=A0A9P4VVK9_9PEZI|nr:hypothetical protein M501DRAFT_994681 [Patellaria atrata CBS 101060]